MKLGEVFIVNFMDYLTDVPKDRHRWWFTYDDVIYFFTNFEKKNDCKISIFSNLPRANLIRQADKTLSS